MVNADADSFLENEMKAQKEVLKLDYTDIDLVKDDISDINDINMNNLLNNEKIESQNRRSLLITPEQIDIPISR